MIRHFLIVVTALFFLAQPGGAVQPDEILADPVLEQRARELSKNVRCVVCQNQTIDESEADQARDLRLVVRERLMAGDSDEEVLDYLVYRYGDWVLLRTPVKAETLALWLLPLVLLGIAAASVLFWYRGVSRRAKKPAQALSAEEKARLDALLGEDD
ncbi:cytochrome c-type biogenesis protein [Aestuariispira insulae]|uniref:Cytochrome c-type biogenesis protein n=1 Tax=Aestuariispira insulae TaxID=1461337 RepID=A0A3D9HQ09_9PROT|nr:cytochrome c-type biogenesis protein [Aestuariispira insulae]RED51562.1 cytochrome c-type biogenesis protein CcmH [Aestuariispira insulae]